MNVGLKKLHEKVKKHQEKVEEKASFRIVSSPVQLEYVFVVYSLLFQLVFTNSATT